MKINGLDLFSGIGGISLALEPWVRTIAYCEADRYAQAVLLSRMRSGQLHHAPIWDDVRTLRGDSLGNWIDIIYGGFPCQDISVAGVGKGLGGERSGLFFEVVRLIEEIRPPFVFLENVPAIRTRGAARVYFELAHLGYDIRWTTLSAESVGANHKRNRWFLLAANADRINLRGLRRWSSRALREGPTFPEYYGEQKSVAHSKSFGIVERRLPIRASAKNSRTGVAGENGPGKEIQMEPREGTISECFSSSWWSVEPDVGRVVNGLPSRVDRLRCLGNAVVPIQAREAFKKLAGLQ